LAEESTGSGWDGVDFLHSSPYGATLALIIACHTGCLLITLISISFSLQVKVYKVVFTTKMPSCK